jgi:hypothetical protein
MHAAKIDMPAVLAFGIAAAGQFGLLKRAAERSANYQSLGDRNAARVQRVVAVDHSEALPLVHAYARAWPSFFLTR